MRVYYLDQPMRNIYINNGFLYRNILLHFSYICIISRESYFLVTSKQSIRLTEHDTDALKRYKELTVNLLKSTGHVMHQQFNIQQLYFCPHCIYVFCIYLRTNSDLCHLQHKLIGFYNEMRSVYCAVRTGSLNKAVCASFLTF